MIVKEEKILEWDDKEKVLKIRREMIRKIVLEEVLKYEERGGIKKWGN
jgi:hypothetical protein